MRTAQVDLPRSPPHAPSPHHPTPTPLTAHSPSLPLLGSDNHSSHLLVSCHGDQHVVCAQTQEQENEHLKEGEGEGQRRGAMK